MSDIVTANTEDNAIIISKKSDKIFFPKRDVIYDLYFDVDYSRVRSLIKSYPVYLWDWQHNVETVNYLNTSIYNPANLMIVPAGVGYNNMSLYEIKINE